MCVCVQDALRSAPSFPFKSQETALAFRGGDVAEEEEEEEE